MTIHLSFPLFLPLATALVAAFLPARIGRWLVVAGTVAVLGYAIALVVDFDSADAGLQYVTDDEWIPELGIRYQLGDAAFGALTAIHVLEHLEDEVASETLTTWQRIVKDPNDAEALHALGEVV